MKPKLPDPQTAPAPVVFRVNVIVPVAEAPGGSRFFPAGEPSPYDDISEVSDHLRPFVVTADDEPEAEEEGRANYELGVTYQMTEGGNEGAR